METSYNSSTTKPLYKGTQIVWYILGLLEILFAFRFALKLLAANQSAGFTTLIYKATYVFLAPFNTVFKVTSVENNVFEWTTLLAMVVYWIVAMAIVKFFLMSKTVSTGEAAVGLNKQE